ncbi:hypothetical protein Aoki45_31550 [Algoriphagus sp. oki45]|nr:hypothetical protein Aoki45_31550 [Algoriphagus sp. oki45]
MNKMTKYLKMLELTFFKTMQVRKDLTFKKRNKVFNGLINVKLKVLNVSVSHIKSPIQLLSECIKEMVMRKFYQICRKGLFFYT